MKKTAFFLMLMLIASGLVLFGCGGHGVDQIPASSSSSVSTVSSTSSSSGSTSSTTTTLSPTATFSISGAVKFANTNDPVMGGVYLTLKNNSGTVSSSIANSNTGAFSFNGIHTGSFTLEATKEGWANSQEAIFITAADINTNFSLVPAQWDILHVGGGLAFNGITSYEGTGYPAFSGKMYVGCDDGSIRQSSAPFTNWTFYPSPAYNPLVCMIGLSIPSFHIALFTFDNQAYEYGISDEAIGWLRGGPVTPEGVKSAFFVGEFVIITAQSNRLMASGIDLTPTIEAGLILNNFAASFTAGSTVTMEVVGDNGKAFLAILQNPSITPEWQAINLGTSDNLTACSVPPFGIGMDIIASATGSIYTSPDHFSWAKEISGIPYAIKNAYSTLSGEVFVCGENGLIMRRK